MAIGGSAGSGVDVVRERLADAARTIELLRDELRVARSRRREPVAVIGLALRLPGGAQAPEQFWSVLRDGVDTTGEFPGDRGDARALHHPDPDHPGTAYVVRGAFLDRVDGFDPAVFGISPREAVGMDPQQRIALELAWEALERAGHAPDRLAGTATGVWVGISTTDYVRLRQQRGDMRDIDAYQLVGEPSFTAGRISYALGLQGPSSVLDTTCSSSLVAVHQACQALRTGECDLAIAGGANVMLTPYGFVLMSKFRALSPDGRCKTFDESADGYARGEGAVMLVLKRLGDALADGDPVQAVVAGTAVNHDGRSSGLTVPNPEAQQRVIRAALEQAGIAPAAVGYVEAHGTGTALGDPIELHALDAVYREGRPDDDPLVVGSVKTNIGHLEAAAGAAGLAKVILSLGNETIPPHLHLSAANPKVDWHRLRVVIPTEPRPWRRGDRPRVAGLSSFGASGTNAHAVVTEPPPPPPRELPGTRAEALLLSARTPTALATLAASYADHLDATATVPLADVAWTTQAGRARMDHGVAVTATDHAGAAAALRAVAGGRRHPAATPVARAPHRHRRTAWLFTGQGAQYAGMAGGLRELPAFAAALDECSTALDPLLPAPLHEVIWGGDGHANDGRVNDTRFTQPALFAVEYATARALLALGARPSALIGHSVGEIAAACIAGALDLDAAARLVAARAALMSALPRDGAMVALACDERTARAAINGFASSVSVAAVNAPSSVVVSGSAVDVRSVAAHLRERGVQAQPLTVSHAFHSPLMRPMADELRQALADLPARRPRLPLISGVTGDWWDDECLTTDYWVRHALGTVRFADGMRRLHDDGVRTYVEVGPHPVLTVLGQRCVPGDEATWLAPMRKGGDDMAGLMATLGALDLRGERIDWRAAHEGRDVRRTLLPTYPWERSRYWFRAADGPPADGPPVPGIGRRVRAAVPTFEDEAGPVAAGDELGWLVSRAAAAAGAATGRPAGSIGPATLDAPPPADAGAPWLVQWSVHDDGDRLTVRADGATAAQHRAGAAWHRHGSVTFPAGDTGDTGEAGEATAFDAGSPPDDAVTVPMAGAGDGAGWDVLLAGCRTAVARASGRPPTACVPVALDRLTVTDPAAVTGLAVRISGTDGGGTADGWLLDAAGDCTGRLRGLRWRSEPVAARAPWYADESLLLDIAWRDVSAVAPATDDARVVLVGGPAGLRAALAVELRGRGVDASELADLADLADPPADGGPATTLVVLLDAAGLPAAAGTDAAVLTGRLLPLELSTVSLVRRLAAAPAQRARVVLVTRGTARVDGADPVHGPAGSTLWGLGRVVALEHPETWGGAIDLAADGDDPATVADALLSLAVEDQQAVRGARRFAPRLVPADAAALPAPGTGPALRGTALVTGGLGGIGLAIAGWLATRGVERVVLTARASLPPEREWAALPPGHPAAERVRGVRRLRATGLDVVVEVVDATDVAAMRALVARLAADPRRPLRGVVHAAGVSEPQLLREVDADAYARTWRPKVLGAWALHEATTEIDLDLFVLLTSIASTWGSQHLAGYAAGNAFLDGLAHLRRAQGRRALAVNWGPWELPSSLFGAEVMAFLRSVGLRPLAPDQCLSLLDRLTRTDAAQRIVCAADWSAYKPVLEARARRPMLAEIELPDEAPEAIGSEDMRAAILAAGEEGGRSGRIAALAGMLRSAVAGALGVDSAALGPDADVFGMGLDSVMVMQLRTHFHRSLRVQLRPGDLFERSTVEEWAAHLDGLLTGGADESDAATATAAAAAKGTGTSAPPTTPAELAPLSRLAPDVVPRAPVRTGAGHALLTGATGFVGAYLLHELVRAGAPQITCLVRCTDEEHGRRRLRANLRRYLPDDATDLRHVRVVPADLGRPGLGLDDRTRAALTDPADGVDAIYHNGAWVNFAHAFEQLRAANVGGTEELLRLGARAGAPVHHVSTYGIWGLPAAGRDRIGEDDDITTAGRLVTGYVQSKWAAEHLVAQAAERGAPVAVYRLGRVLGDSRTGAALTSHFTCRVIKGCIQLGMAPDLDIDVEMTPVDYVAAALVRIAGTVVPGGGTPRTFHLINPRHLRFGALVRYLDERGWAVETVDRHAWWQALQQSMDTAPNELHPVMDTVRELVVGGERAIDYDVANTEAALAGSGITCPPLDERLLAVYVGHFIDSGYLDEPGRRATARRSTP
ncbi:MAG: thioester reductase domain-containing protein [Frankiaceae bacterium]